MQGRSGRSKPRSRSSSISAIDGLLGHAAHGGQLAAGHRQHARGRPARWRARARWPRGWRRRWPAAGAARRRWTARPSGSQRRAGEGVVGRLQQVVDVARRGRGCRRRARRAGPVAGWPVGVGGADDGAQRRRAARTSPGRRAGSVITKARPPVGRRAASTTRCTPRVGRRARPPPRKASENGPVALTTARARMVKRLAAVSRSRARPGGARGRARGPGRCDLDVGQRPAAPARSASSTFSSTRRVSSVWQST